MPSYRHTHDHSYTSGILSLDLYAQSSKFNEVNPALKLWFAIAVLFLCIAADSAAIGLIVALSMLYIIVVYAGIDLHYVLSLMKVPGIFILISCLTILVNFSEEPLGFIDLPVFQTYLSITYTSINQAGTLFLKAYGAISSLYFLSLTTPIQEIIHVLRKYHIPDVIIELMYLIYRYIFLLIDIQNQMTISAQSRLGYVGYKNAWYTFTHISGNLLALSFRKSNTCYDAMESRCYQGRLSFLTTETPLKLKHILSFLLYIFILLALIFILKTTGVDLF